MPDRTERSRHPLPGNGLALVLAALATGTLLAVPPAPAKAGGLEDIVSSTVRRHGHACAGAVSASREAVRSDASMKSWLLRCDSALYRVLYTNDRRTHVEVVD